MVIEANSYIQASTWIGFTAGPLLAGLLVTISGSGLALAVNAVLYALAAAGLAAMRLSTGATVAASDAGPPARPALRAQLRAGYSYLRSDIDAGMVVVIVRALLEFGQLDHVSDGVSPKQVLRADRQATRCWWPAGRREWWSARWPAGGCASAGS
jgi:hypothetical protein